MVSRIKKIGPEEWQAPSFLGREPIFKIYHHGHSVYERGIREDLVNPPPQVIHWEKSKLINNETEEQVLPGAYKYYAASQHQDYLDMRVDSVSNRGRLIWPAILVLAIWFFVKIWTVFWDGESWTLTPWFDWPFVIGGACCFAWDLFRRAQLPVRFHMKNQEVYVYYRSVLYRIPWNECEMSVQVAMFHTGAGNMKDGYELVLWLNPAHAVNKTFKQKKFRRLVLIHQDILHFAPYLYWEYVRRFMFGKPAYESEVPQQNIFRFKKKFIPIVVGIFIFPYLILYRSGEVALHIDNLNPFKRRWPKEVDEWTGEKCNWH